MTKKRLVICGDSFMSPTNNLPGTHFSEIISERLNMELIPLSRSAMSNGGIVSQLEYALTLDPSFIIFNTTFADRIEFTLTNDNLSDGDGDLTCKDFYYGDRKDYSCNIINDNEPIIGSESIESLVRNDSFFKNKMEATNLFLNNIYNRRWKIQTDKHLIYSISHRIFLKRIPFILMLDIINAADNMSWLPETHRGFDWTMLDNIRLINKPIDYIDPGYHTTIDVQEVLADHTIKKMREWNF
jgi:hypothetical protein